MFDQPKLHIDVDRTKAQEIGFSQLNVAQNLLISLSGSFQTQPTFWLDPRTGRELQHRHANAPVSRRYVAEALRISRFPRRLQRTTGILADVAAFSRGSEMGLVSHYDVQPVIDIFGSVQGRDLGGVARDIEPILKRAEQHLPRGSQIDSARRNPDDERVLCRPALRTGVLDRARLSA